MTTQTKLGVIAITALTLNLLTGVLSVIFSGGRSKVGRRHIENGNRVVATMHAMVVVATAAFTVLVDASDDASDETEPWLGALGLCVSVGYFMYDACMMPIVGFTPLLPLIAHHLWSGLTMAWVAFGVPRAVWYACLLQCSEATVPCTHIVWLLENRTEEAKYGNAAKVTMPRPLGAAYAAARWLQLATWMLFREVLFVGFGSVVVRHWASMSTPMQFLGVGCGVPLFVFNTGGLIAVILPGCPWTAEAKLD